MAAAPPPRTEVRLAARNPAAVTSRKFGSAPRARSAVVQPAVPSSSTARARTAAAPSASQPARRRARVPPQRHRRGPQQVAGRVGLGGGQDRPAQPEQERGPAEQRRRRCRGRRGGDQEPGEQAPARRPAPPATPRGPAAAGRGPGPAVVVMAAVPAARPAAAGRPVAAPRPAPARRGPGRRAGRPWPRRPRPAPASACGSTIGTGGVAARRPSPRQLLAGQRAAGQQRPELDGVQGLAGRLVARWSSRRRPSWTRRARSAGRGRRRGTGRRGRPCPDPPALGSPTWTSVPRQVLWTNSGAGTMRTRVGTPGSPANSPATGSHGVADTYRASRWPYTG